MKYILLTPLVVGVALVLASCGLLLGKISDSKGAWELKNASRQDVTVELVLKQRSTSVLLRPCGVYGGFDTSRILGISVERQSGDRREMIRWNIDSLRSSTKIEGFEWWVITDSGIELVNAPIICNP